jgi:hypothetical protein
MIGDDVARIAGRDIAEIRAVHGEEFISNAFVEKYEQTQWQRGSAEV